MLLQSGGTTTIPAGTSLSAGALTLTGGTLNGSGTFSGPVTNTGGTVAPGNSPGTLTVSGNYSQGSGGTLAIAVDGSGAGVLRVNGNATLAGTLALAPSNGYASSAAPGDAVPFLSYTGNRTGTVSSVTVNPTLANSESFVPDYGTAHVVNAIVGKGSQSISFPSTGVTYGQAGFSPASAGSRLPISYSNPSGQCVVDAQGLVQITGTGSCTITASQAGNSDYQAATPVTQMFAIAKTSLLVNAGDASVTFGQTPTLTYTLDALHGSLALLAAVGNGKTEHGIFGGAIFKLTQSKSGANRGLTTLSLLKDLFKGASSYAIRKAHKAADATTTALSSKTLQLLHASAHGKFRTSGRYSAATVRGTIWTVADRCDGILTHDMTDSVAVQDFVRHKTIILHAGQSYLARKP